MVYIKKILFISIIFLINIKLFSHPHVFINYETKYNIEEGRIKKINIIWQLDRPSSNAYFTTYDMNMNYQFDKIDYINFKNQIFYQFDKNKFYYRLSVNENVIDNSKVENFKSDLSRELLITFSFDIICDIPLNDNINDLKITFNDRVFYIAFSCKQEKADLVSDNSIGILSYAVKNNHEQLVTIKK